jgi:hypothetical protein
MRHVLLALLLVGCAAEAPENLASQGGTIMGGTPADGYPEAVHIDLGASLCSGVLVARKVALTAGHCLTGSPFIVHAPYAHGAIAHGTRTWTPYESLPDDVNRKTLDVAVLLLDEAIDLPSYPAVASKRVDDGTLVVNVGRIRDGDISFSKLFVGREVKVTVTRDFPLAYRSAQIAEHGDSGGPAYVGIGAARTVVGLGSGIAHGKQYLARVDLAFADIHRFIEASN